MFGFLKDALKRTVEKFTKEVDKATEKIEPTEEEKEELFGEIEKEEKPVSEREEKKKEFHDEGYGVEEEKREEAVEEIEEETSEAREEISEKEEDISKEEEKKGFFAKLKERFLEKEEAVEEKEEKEEEKEEEFFPTTEEERKDFEETFEEVEEIQKPKEAIEEEGKEEEKEEIIPVVTETEKGETVFELQEKPTAVGKKKKEKERREEKPEEEKEKIEEKKAEEETGFFGTVKEFLFKTSLSEEKFEELFWELEMVLLENNVAMEVIDLIKKNLKKELVEKKILRGQIDDIIKKTLQNSVEQTFDVPQIDFIEKVKAKKPYVVVFVGINGSGKTTTIAKMVQKLKDHHLSCVIAAGDTFRAAAIQQLEEHANKLKVKLIKHDYGADPAAVGFDAIAYAKAHNIDCVLVDTAGRLHSNVNLMDEMKKIIRVTKPDLKIFVGEAITGNDCVDQARRFHEAIGIDGIILAKADVDEKGGAALSISYVTGKPILYLGTGQKYSDLEEFDKEKILAQIGLG